MDKVVELLKVKYINHKRMLTIIEAALKTHAEFFCNRIVFNFSRAVFLILASS